MTITWADAVAKLAAGYWNSEPVSAGNPGGFDEATDGSRAGHEVNFPAALEAVGVAAQHVGDTAQAVDAAAAAQVAALQAIANRVDGALASTVSTSEVGRALVNAATAADARAVLGVSPTVAATETLSGTLTRAEIRRAALRHLFAAQ